MLVKSKHDLAVTIAFEIILVCELVSLLLEVVELSVDDRMGSFFSIVEWLVAGWAEIDYGETSASKA